MKTICPRKVFFIPLPFEKGHDKQVNTMATEVVDKVTLREQILTYTLRALMRNGIKSVTMDQIAEGLSISKRTLYEMFQDKENLVLKCMEQRRKAFITEVEHHVETTDNVLEVILLFFKRELNELRVTDMQFYRDMGRYPKVAAYMDSLRSRDAKHMVETFRQGVKQGLFRADINYEIVELLIAEQMRFLFGTEAWRRFTAIEVFRAIILVNVRGVCTPEGNRILDAFIAENSAEW